MADINELKRRCLAEIDARREEIIALGEDVYKTPELGFKEFKTTARVAEAFRAAGLEPETEIAYTGCKVSTPEAEGPRVAVMGELDCIVCAEHPDCAPNGNIHACGHNVQLANLFGSAVGILKSGVMDQLSGGVDFIAIPSEECADFEYRDGLIDKGEIAFYGGKPEYLRRGGLDKVDIVLQCHMLEMAEKGKLCTVSTDTNGFIAKTVRFIGVGSHAGFAPSEGVNALNMAQLALNNAVSDALVVSRNAALQMERQAKDYSDKALFQAKKFYATWQAYAQTVVSSFTKEELAAFNGLQRKIERVIADYERNARKKAESDIPFSQRMERELEELNRRSRELEEASKVAAASSAESAASSEQLSEQEQSSMQNPIDKVEKAAEQVIDLRELMRANDSLEDLCADLGLVGGKSEK